MRRPTLLLKKKVPLSAWRRAEELLEDREALRSEPYRRRIRKARADAAAGKLVRPFKIA